MGRKKNPNIKTANQQTEYTYDQVQELKKCADDPIYFIKRYVKIQHPTRGAIPFKLYDYQVKMIRAYQQNRYTVVLSARQTGKEQPHSAKLATPTGWITMGDVQPGDTVLTPDGMTSTVLEKYPQGIKKVYRVTFNDGSFADCGIDHLWTTYIHNNQDSSVEGCYEYAVQKQVLTLGEIIEYLKQNYSVQIPVIQKVNFDPQPLPLDPYILGLLIGGGNIYQPETIGFVTGDTCLVEEIYNNIKQHDSTSTLQEFENCQNYRITTTPSTNPNNVVNILYQLKLTGIKSDTKFIPDVYKIGSHEQRLALLQGLMDTNGIIERHDNSKTLTYRTTSLQLRDDIRHLVWGLGGICSYSVQHPQNSNHEAYDLYISLSNPKDCFRLKRKRDLCHNIWKSDSSDENDIRRTIVDITEIGVEQSSCILIDHPDHLYITDNFTVTHNSISAAAYLLWYAIFHFDKIILIASNKNSNAMEMVLRIRFSYESLPMWLKPGIQEDGWNKHSIGFDNGSRIVSTATSDDSGRGMAISLLYLDEFAFVAPGIQDEFWTSIAPTLSTGGSCIMTSTPNGDMNIFAQIWYGAQTSANGFYPVRVNWDEPPGRNQKFKEEEMGRIGERRWLQEYECEFLSSDALLIDSIVLQNLTTELKEYKPKSTIDNTVFWDDIKQGGTYLIGVDPATGSGSDFTVFTVFEFPALIQVAEYRSNTMSTNDAYDVLKKLLKYLESKDTNVYFSVENNGVGEGIISLYEADENSPENAEFVSEGGKGKRGMTTVSRAKMKACVNLREMITKHTLLIRSPILLAELKMFVRKRGAYAAQLGGTDDCVSAVLIVVRLLEEIASFDQTAFDKLYVGTNSEGWTDDDFDDFDENDSPLPFMF